MNSKLRTSLFLLLTGTISFSSFASTDPLIGKWKTIDDRTGYSLSDVIIQKDKNNHYSATIIDVRAVPGAYQNTVCEKCIGANKNKPLIGMTMLSGLTLHPDKNNEFIDGTFLDPVTGQQYPARARLGNHGKHLIIRGSKDGSAIGRNITWVKN
ncbi:DUF2147 domain-containing protein [Acinetobacter sp. ANC 4862]|jgi:hypothetical protein|uniref:DUF2147 domain-containing protein n=1 Tax=Acinetobacter sp. ANC 4862 TaxID=2529849 RepID=UPI0010399972|nr:DUF2147 domain-containing protein [Acinetobacter sp. ANC 4862]TCH64854.1 DUF2147 domain-containing protein [Acinetobacter sp. ANC 4862]